MRTLLTEQLREALASRGVDASAFDVTAASDARYGDYQTNAAMVLAKALRRNPRELAGEIAASIDVAGISHRPTVAGPGFINFEILSEFLARQVAAMREGERLGVPLVDPTKTIVIDFSSPNVAKPMHAGHIRSTILGDSLARIARFLGHRVITDNHLGDWGTQFGKVIYGWKNLLDREALERDAVSELARLYREVNTLEAKDDSLRDACRAELVKLQRGDPTNLSIWQRCVELSWQSFQAIYDALDVRFDERLGESFYNDQLAPLVEKLLGAGIAEISDGAACVFFPDRKDLEEQPFLIRKSDGGFLYSTTDLATVEYRLRRWRPDAIWYVTGAPQQLHFKQLFATCQRMGINTQLEHIAFGSILGEDRKMMKTRSGENVPLAEVLDEAVARASGVLADRRGELDQDERAAIARVIGLGAVKYAELSQHRMTDYVFSWDKLLSLHGNTAPYLQNAYVRIRSIFRKLDVEPAFAQPVLADPAERALALHLIRFREAVPDVLDEFRPNLLANYLFELANHFHGFYEACPVLKADEPVRAGRLTLCDVASRVLRQGLDLLGISVPERM